MLPPWAARMWLSPGESSERRVGECCGSARRGRSTGYINKPCQQSSNVYGTSTVPLWSPCAGWRRYYDSLERDWGRMARSKLGINNCGDFSDLLSLLHEGLTTMGLQHHLVIFLLWPGASLHILWRSLVHSNDGSRCISSFAQLITSWVCQEKPFHEHVLYACAQ